jgi:predicted SAM-dependent methyltransferase
VVFLDLLLKGKMQVTELIRLNLGAGDEKYHLPGYRNIDRKNGGEIYPVSNNGDVYAPGTVDEIRCSHAIEHMPYRDGPKAIRHWVSLLKHGGKLRIATPDFDKIVKAIGDGNPDGWPMQGYIYGAQTDANDFHQAGYNEAWLTRLMSEAGLTDIKRWESDIQDCAALPVSLNLEGTKRPGRHIPVAPRKIPKTVACMSLPRHSFTANMFAGLELAYSRQIHFEKAEGAFFHQCLERVMTPHVDCSDCEWILTLDYDTYFTVGQFDELARLMIEHPEADAIAPMQVKRDENNLLMGLLQDDGTPYPAGTQITIATFEPELIRASWAHFGLTLFRVSSLAKMNHPWFYESPNAQGRWEEGRIDADIGFWKNWTATGNKLFLATKVLIGHCQQMVSVPDENLKVSHMYLPDLQKCGFSQGLRR